MSEKEVAELNELMDDYLGLVGLQYNSLLLYRAARVSRLN